MIPTFPKFKNLELGDRADIESLTKKFQPYSDYNFTSLWCWDTYGQIQVSKLHGNLVIRFTDYLTGEPFYSFMGTIDVDHTVSELLKLSHNQSLTTALRLIPEESAKLVNTNNYSV